METPRAGNGANFASPSRGSMKPSPGQAVLVALGAALLAYGAACARSVDGGTGDDQQFSPTNPAPLSACIETACPAPFATCGGGAPCGTDTSRDVANCGGCGVACPQAPNAHQPVCSDSACAMACDELFADCNHQSADGCEVSLVDDPKNCGACGVACKGGEICWRGACGCPSGFTLCGGDCKNLATDDSSCGACDAACKPPPSGDPAWLCGSLVQPWQTTWGCDGTCKMICKGAWADCNRDLCADGCEVDTSSDAQNCGACGRACTAGQQCMNGECLCPAGTTRCGNHCVDTNVDILNCGGCGNDCDGASDATAHGGPTCTGGRCGYVCYPGFADCNHNLFDGCEADLRSDQENCGGCGVACDVAKGQPCVGGKCLTKPCDAPEVPK